MDRVSAPARVARGTASPNMDSGAADELPLAYPSPRAFGSSATQSEHLTDNEGTLIVARQLIVPPVAPALPVAAPVRVWPVVVAGIAAVAMIALALLVR